MKCYLCEKACDKGIWVVIPQKKGPSVEAAVCKDCAKKMEE